MLKTRPDNALAAGRFARLARPLARRLCPWILCFFGATSQCLAASFSFAAFGDTPYTLAEEASFIGIIAEMNRAPLAFAIHVGDFKSGWSPCTDELVAQRRDWFALFHHPLIYAPGDNEWTDCRRAPGAGRDPVERLAHLRRVFFADEYSLGQRKIALERQSADYPEHARWEHGAVLFATLNVPGGDNNAGMPHEYAARDPMVGAWIADTFRVARAQRHGAVVLAMQADPWTSGGIVKKNYSALMTVIAREAQRFDGEVLLIHGDTHRYRVDKPLIDLRTGQPLRNVTRIEVFGSPAVNWVRISVTQESGRVRFDAAAGS
jgi:hypothetical protein